MALATTLQSHPISQLLLFGAIDCRCLSALLHRHLFSIVSSPGCCSSVQPAAITSQRGLNNYSSSLRLEALAVQYSPYRCFFSVTHSVGLLLISIVPHCCNSGQPALTALLQFRTAHNDSYSHRPIFRLLHFSITAAISI